MPWRDWCASGRRERASTIAAPLVAPLETRPRGASPSPSYTEKPDGRDGPLAIRGRRRGRDDSEWLLATPTTPAPFRDTRRRRRASELRMRCARRVCSVVVLASRPRAASNGHRSRGYRMFRRSSSGGVRARSFMMYSLRALGTAGVARADNDAAGGYALLAADLGESFGAAASVLPVGAAWTRAASALGLRAARGAGPY